MRNTHIILVAFLLFNCADNNIAPAPPDQDASSKKLSNQIVWKDFKFSLENANVFLIWKVANRIPESGYGFFNYYVVTDGTELINPFYRGFYIDDWKDATYSFMIVLYSYSDVTISKGDYTLAIGTDPGRKEYVWFMQNDFYDMVPSIPPLSSYPIFEFNNESDFDAILKVKGRFEDGDKISFQWEGLMRGFVYHEPLNATGYFPIGSVEWGEYPGSFYYQGLVQDISPKVMKGLTGSRRSIQDPMAMIMKQTKRHN